ncbi:hypothetical protein TcCL_Unassigned02020 [Trypanosoma cruzi]|nr:hypothetical protein TcCL_Unassigned02020 [Trypanosoma cruzi]
MKKEHTLVKKFLHLVAYQIKNSFKKLPAFYVSIESPNKHLPRRIVVFHQRSSWSQYNSTKILSFKLVLRVSPSSIRSSTRLSRVHDSHSLLPATCRAAASEPTQMPLAPKDSRGCFVPQSQWRWAWHSHGSVVGAPRSRTATPVGETVESHRPRSNATCNRPQHRHIIVLFYFILFTFSVCLFSLSLTLKISVHLHKRIKRKHDPTVPMQLSTLLHPPPLPHTKTQSHRRVNTTMCTTPSCTERWARRSHTSPRSIFPPLKCCVPAQSSKQNQSAHKPNHPLTR